MSHSRVFALLLAAVSLLAAFSAHAGTPSIGVADQYIPSGKTLVVPIPAADTTGSARSYTVTVGPPISSGSATITGSCGIIGTIRTGDPHFILTVSYTDSNSKPETGTMEFQLLREFAPLTTQIIAGLTEGGFYSPTTVSGTTKYITFHRIVPGFVIQGGDPNGNGSGGPGFTFPNEFSRALIFSGTAGQLAMANSGYGITGSDVVTTSTSASTSGTTITTGTSTIVLSASNGTNGSQFFITLSNSMRSALDYGYTLFGQMLRGFSTLDGIAGTPINYGDPMYSGGEIVYTSPLNPVNITSAIVTHNDTDAVLLLSATGVCNALVTVTALSGTVPIATGTFMAHAVPDTIDDPPVLEPVANSTAPNGNLKVTLSGTDLQLDLLRYGFERLQPVDDPELTSGTSPTVTIPLISNTDNAIGATLDQWNPVGSAHGYDTRIFHVGADDKPVTGALTPITTGTDNKVTSSPVAVFTAGNPNDTAASFAANVNWGDGTYLSGTEVTIVKTGPGNRYKLLADHTYSVPGEYPVLVHIHDPGGAYLTLTGTANIPGSTISISGRDISNTGGKLTNQLLATFTDSKTPSLPADYTATINWGDGAVSAGVIRKAGASYQVIGTHVYPGADTFTVSTAVTRAGGATAHEWSAAHIANTKAPELYPPFTQAHLAQVWSVILTDSNTVVTGTADPDGGNPLAPLVVGPDGNLYGTTLNGGPSGLGTVYKIATSSTYATLYSFTGGNDGAHPTAGLLTGTDGYLYGTTSTDGTDGAGTIFKVSTSGSLTTLYPFNGGDNGGNPDAGLVTGTDGNYYGTTSAGGSASQGTVFQYTTGGSYNSLYSFTGGADGGNPKAGLVTGTDGDLYGTTETGSNNFGTVFRITTGGSLTTLYLFTGGTNGGNPYASLITGTDGNLYGTTLTGGDEFGTVFRITTSGSLTTLYKFTGNTDGGQPHASLLSASDGQLYGTTEGTTAITTGTTPGSYGSVFQLTYSGSLAALHDFTTGADGGNPQAGLVTGTDGNFYGATEDGGDAGGDGTVYRITSSGSLTTIHAFSGTTTGTTTNFQIAVSASVAIVNSGNKPSPAGSFSAYADQSGTLDGAQTILTSGSQTAFPIPALQPGQYYIIQFQQEGSVVDTRLKLPVGFNPTGYDFLGVVTYKDPVGDFDGSRKVISLGQF